MPLYSSTHFEIQVYHVAVVKECHTLQNLSHQSLHILFFKGLVPLSDALVKNLPSCSTEHTKINTCYSTQPSDIQLQRLQQHLWNKLKNNHHASGQCCKWMQWVYINAFLSFYFKLSGDGLLAKQQKKEPSKCYLHSHVILTTAQSRTMEALYCQCACVRDMPRTKMNSQASQVILKNKTKTSKQYLNVINCTPNAIINCISASGLLWKIPMTEQSPIRLF